MKTYLETIKYLYNHLPMFQRIGSAAYKNTLGNTNKLDELYGYPHKCYKTVHVAGTNGKGSVSHTIASVFQEAGYKVGLYTSPHLVSFRERIRVNGEMISESDVTSFLNDYLNKKESKTIQPSFFEITVAMAFDYFRKCKVDIAIIEVGLGGRLDSTNIIKPEISVITNISFDHMALLGNTIFKIAGEKAGIIKQGIPVVISESNEEYNSVFNNKAEEEKSDIFYADSEYQVGSSSLLPDEGKQIFMFKKTGKLNFSSLKSDLMGDYQKKNIAAVLKTVELLRDRGWKISRENIEDGIEKVKVNTGLRGRWDIMHYNPMVICDTGHNVAGLKWVTFQLSEMKYKKLHFVLGMVNDKDLKSVLKLLPKDAEYYFTQASIPRARKVEELATMATEEGLHGRSFDTVKHAAAAAIKEAENDDVVFIGGSSYVVADYLS